MASLSLSLALDLGCTLSLTPKAPGLGRVPPARAASGTGGASRSATRTNAEPPGLIYEVKEGDTFWDIAIEHGLSLEALAAANPSLTPSRLDIGQRLIIPQQATPTPPSVTTAPAAVTSTAAAPGSQPAYATSTTPAVGQTPTPQPFLTFDYGHPEAGSADDGESGTGWQGLIIDLGTKLALIVGLIYVTIWLLRRYLSRGGATSKGSKSIRVVEQFGLAPNRAIYLVEVGSRLLVLGATQNQINLLAEIEDADLLEELKGSKMGTPIPRSFASYLNSFAARFDGASSKDEEASSPRTSPESRR